MAISMPRFISVIKNGLRCEFSLHKFCQPGSVGDGVAESVSELVPISKSLAFLVKMRHI